MTLFLQLWFDSIDEGILTIGAENFQTLVALARCIDRSGYCYPSQRGKLALLLGVSPSAINKRIGRLKKIEFKGKPIIETEKQKKGVGGKWEPLRYRVNPAIISIFNRKDQVATVDKMWQTVPPAKTNTVGNRRPTEKRISSGELGQFRREDFEESTLKTVGNVAVNGYPDNKLYPVLNDKNDKENKENSENQKPLAVKESEGEDEGLGKPKRFVPSSCTLDPNCKPKKPSECSRCQRRGGLPVSRCVVWSIEVEES